MKKQEEIARKMYAAHKEFMENATQSVNLEWDELNNTTQSYFLTMAECAIDSLLIPNDEMLAAVIKEWKRPKEVKNDSLSLFLAEEFKRLNRISLKASKISRYEKVKKS